MSSNDVDILHIYQQDSHHMPAHIAGNRRALEGLKLLIDMALRNGVATIEGFTQSDGECYDITVACVQDAIAWTLPSAYIDYPCKWSDEDKVLWEAAFSGMYFKKGNEE